MPDYDFKKIKKILEKQLEPKRYEHTLGVAYTAASLAMCYHVDVEKAYLAGLLHDCAKCIENDKKMALCRKYEVILTDTEIENPFLIHAKLGSVLAKEKYGISDEEVLNAIACHTTGKEKMSLLEKIIFCADYVEPGRKMIPGMQEIRDILFDDLDMAVFMILKNTLLHLEEKKQVIDETSLNAYKYYEKFVGMDKNNN